MKDLIAFLRDKTRVAEQESIRTVKGETPLTQDLFQALPSAADANLAFVDGGIAPLARMSQLGVFLVRTAVVRFQNTRRTGRDVETFFLLIFPDNERLQCKTFPEHAGLDISRSMDTPLEDLANLVRRLAELHVAAVAASKCMVILDGSLDHTEQEELSLIDALRTLPILALSKTTDKVTLQGHALPHVLGKRQGTWQYGPLALSDNYATWFVRLHPKAQHVFRIDAGNDAVFRDSLGQLALHAKDPVFLGYPYGLILADQLARISHQEQERTRHALLLRAGQDVRDILATKDAHAILDSIS